MIRRTRLSIVFIAAVLMTTVLQPAGAAESESGTPVPEARSTQSQEVAGRVDVVIGDRYVDLTDRVGNRIRMNVPATKLPGQEEPTPVTRFDSGTFGLAISPIADGASALIEISGPDAPTEYVFDFEMPTDWSLVERSDGSVTITDSEGDIVGSIAPPWAVDANADELATSFKVQGANTLVQTVNHEGASYPVLADPSITFGSNIYLWVRGYEIYWWGSVSAAYLAGWICAISGGTLCGLVVAGAAALQVAFNTVFAGNNCRYVIAFRYWIWPNYMERLNQYGCSYYKTDIPG